MQHYDYILAFDDDQRSLSAKNGIPASQLAELILSLNKALNLTNDETFVLSEVKDGSYALNFTTNSFTAHNKLEAIHRKISSNDFSGLNADQRKHAEKLKFILGGKYHVNAYDPRKNEEVRIENIVLPSKPEFYYEIGTIYGVVTAIGGKSIDGKSAIHVSETPYDIEVTPEQERSLVKHFKKDKLHLSVRRKIHFGDEKILGAVLEDFEKTSGKSFGEAARDFQERHPNGLFDDLGDSAEAVRQLRQG